MLALLDTYLGEENNPAIDYPEVVAELRIIFWRSRYAFKGVYLR
ncbi:hypothetical protein [Arenibacter sp. F26102]|nr:hypothetical protein [Arenibacter sp. F26102]